MLAGLYLTLPDVIASICISVTNLVTNARMSGCTGILQDFKASARKHFKRYVNVGWYDRRIIKFTTS